MEAMNEHRRGRHMPERTERETAAIERMAHEAVYLAYASDGPTQAMMRRLAQEVLPEHIIEEFRSPPPLFTA